MYDVWFHWLDSMKSIIPTNKSGKNTFTEYLTRTNIVDILYQHSNSTLTSHITKHIIIFLNTLYTLPSTKNLNTCTLTQGRFLVCLWIQQTNKQLIIGSWEGNRGYPPARQRQFKTKLANARNLF